jgi:hypothetical protein
MWYLAFKFPENYDDVGQVYSSLQIRKQIEIRKKIQYSAKPAAQGVLLKLSSNDHKMIDEEVGI